MNDLQWNSFLEFKNSFKNKCKEWQKYSEQLIPLQRLAASKDTPDYNIENPILYNSALDTITKESDIKLIVIGDNPGKNEQLQINQKYLVGQAGKIADSFFKKNPELQIDFRQNVIILNKTPVHSAKTNHLTQIERELQNKNVSENSIIKESQIWLAEKTARLHKELVQNASESAFVPELWLVGYSELKKNGIFSFYRNVLQEQYKDCLPAQNLAWQKVFVYQHFSMNRFSIDLNSFRKKSTELNLKQSLEALGKIHKNEIFCEL